MEKVMVTGHRQIIPLGWRGNPWPDRSMEVAQHHHSVLSLLQRWCLAFHKNHTDGIPEFITGMALGADQLFAQAVLNIKKMGKQCHLVAAVPFKGQESQWPDAHKRVYQSLLSQCDEVVFVSPPGYTPQKMHKRNEYMVERATGAVAVWDGKRNGGTWACLQYIIRKSKPVIVLDPLTLIFDKLSVIR